MISTNRFMETIFKIQVKNPTKSLHNQVAASKAPEIWLAADSMKLDSSSSGRITKPQCSWGIQLDSQVHQVGVQKFGRIPRSSHFFEGVKIFFVGEVLEELQSIQRCSIQMGFKKCLRSKTVHGSRIGKAEKYQDDTSHHVKFQVDSTIKALGTSRTIEDRQWFASLKFGYR